MIGRVSQKGNRSLQGGITVFLSMILTCICALLGGLFESARIAGCSWYMQTALDSSLDSLMSCYHREVWERYHLFLLEFEDCQGLASELEPYVETYIDAAPFYPMKEKRLTVGGLTRITDHQGECFEQEILDYMKLGIWGEEEAPRLGEIAGEIREAGDVWEIAEEYQKRGRKVLALERSVDAIGECSRKQAEYLEEGKGELKECDGDGFLRKAARLERELERIPGLVEAYEKKADRLREELSETENMASERSEGLQSDTWQMVKEEMSGYRSYIEEEGSRRQEVREAAELAEKNRAVISRAVEKAKEVQDYIDAWEPEDEDDELDEEALWEKVSDVLKGFERDSRFEKSRVRDKEKMNLLEALSSMSGSDLLTICVPDGMEISNAVLDERQLPSKRSGVEAGEKLHPIELVVRTVLFHEYAGHYFKHALSDEETETGFRYEQEYILHGSVRDRENLRSVVNRLIGIREAFNLVYLLGNTEKREEARTLALAITGAAGLTPLVLVTTFFILTVWAFAESVEDVKLLLGGGKLPILKTDEDWKLSLTELAREGGALLAKKGGKSCADQGNFREDVRGYDYQGWLKLLYLACGRVTMRYRMMDMIQNNIRKIQPEFQMEQCAFGLEAELSGAGSMVPMRWRRRKEY